MQEDIENKSVVLTSKATKMSARVLAALLRAAIEKVTQVRDAPGEGKQSFRELSKGGSVQSIPISDDNIKAFEPFARKFRVRYSLMRDNSENPPKWLVFFQAKDVDAMTAAFREFSAKVLTKTKEKPSTRGAMEKFRELIKNAVRDKTKHKTHGELDL